MLIEVDSRSPDGNVSLYIRGRGAINGPGKVVATLLAAVESITGVSCDEYAEAITNQGR